jgi:hypothetical protein
MSHFAKVENGVVTDVIVAEQDFIDTLPDKDNWIQTSYNTRGGVHYLPDSDTPSEDQTKALRANYAGLGMTYDVENDVFYGVQPFTTWILNRTTWVWESPVPRPEDGKRYRWDDETVSWIEVQPRTQT